MWVGGWAGWLLVGLVGELVDLVGGLVGWWLGGLVVGLVGELMGWWIGGLVDLWICGLVG